MHRLISDGNLVILGMMGNAGLAERGEARIYFGREVDEDPRRFEELQSLPKRLGLEGALQRRDAAVSAYQHLMSLWTTNRLLYRGELERFFEVHQRTMANIADTLLEQVKQGPLAWGQLTQQRIAALEKPGRRRGLRSALIVAPPAEVHSACAVCYVQSSRSKNFGAESHDPIDRVLHRTVRGNVRAGRTYQRL